MNYFWGNIFEYFKDRRVGVVFFGTLTALLVALIVGAILYQVVCAYELQKYLPAVLPGGGLILLVWTWRESADGGRGAWTGIKLHLCRVTKRRKPGQNLQRNQL
jgi:hypothetical protein